MRIANLNGRACLLDGDQALDIATASSGKFGPDPTTIYDTWDGFLTWALPVRVAEHPETKAFDRADLLTPVPRPTQILAVGLNYAEHAQESKLKVPDNPLVFTKFASSLAGTDTVVSLSGDKIDWEAELVVVVGRTGRDIAVADGWDYVAGLSVGQDISDRTVQWWGDASQFSLGKSFAGYAPVGPAVVTVDEFDAIDRDDLRVTSTLVTPGVADRTLQDGRTSRMIFSIPELIARLSAIVELRAGDLIFTGTPAGVGIGLNPPEYLKSGQTLTTEIEGIGEIHQRFI